MHLGVYILNCVSLINSVFLSRILYYFSNIVVLNLGGIISKNPSQIKHNNITGIIYDYELL
jgi:hypothetical protein